MESFFNMLVKLEPPFNMIVLLVFIGSTVTLITTIVKQVRMYASHRADTQLKRELVERGLSVDEIERVVSAKPASNTSAGND